MNPKPEEYPPVSEIVTAYDRRCFKLYVMLLDADADADADADGVEWLDTYRKNFGNCEDNNVQSAYRHYQAHLKRAKWMTTTGYLRLL